MLKIITAFTVALTLYTGTVYAQSASQVTRDPEASKQIFKDVSSRLETGGDLFIVANLDGMVEEYVGLATELARLLPASSGGTIPPPSQIASKVAAFLKQNGFYAVKGAGLSVVPQANGLNSVRMFTSRDAAAALLPLWRGTVGTRPSSMECLSYMPQDTVMVRSGTADLSALWTLIISGISEIGGETAEKGMTAQLTMVEQMLGVSVDAMLQSLQPEGAVSIQLSTTEKVTIPIGLLTTDIPMPSMLILTRVKDDTLLNTVKKIFGTTIPMPLTETLAGETTLYTIPFPLPTPIPLQITLARHGQYLLIGTTADIVSQAITVATEGNGLRSNPEFVTAFSGSETNNNGIIFASKRLGETLADVQGNIMEQSMAANPNAKASMGLARNWMGKQFSSTEAFTIMNYSSGIKISGCSSSGGRELVGSMMMAPIGMLSAIAIPSFMKARTTSQKNTCINNLRQLDSAKEQWAMASGSTDGTEPVEAEVLQYIKGGVMPTCPQGGTYTLNAIGVEPTCSHPDHSLLGH